MLVCLLGWSYVGLLEKGVWGLIQGRFRGDHYNNYMAVSISGGAVFELL